MISWLNSSSVFSEGFSGGSVRAPRRHKDPVRLWRLRKQQGVRENISSGIPDKSEVPSICVRRNQTISGIPSACSVSACHFHPDRENGSWKQSGRSEAFPAASGKAQDWSGGFRDIVGSLSDFIFVIDTGHRCTPVHHDYIRLIPGDSVFSDVAALLAAVSLVIIVDPAEIGFGEGCPVFAQGILGMLQDVLSGCQLPVGVSVPLAEFSRWRCSCKNS